MRSSFDILFRAFLRLVLRIFFRGVEVVGEERLPLGRPMVLVANHLNGLVDAVILLGALPVYPRTLGKSTLWNIPFVRPFLALAGSIPVYRHQDKVDTAQNEETFRLCRELLARGGALALFPEGKSHSEPALQPLKTGIARIVLGAGSLGTRIVPLGLTFDARETFRSRVLIQIGEPLDPEPELAAGGVGNPDAVRALTARVSEGLEKVTLNYASWEDSRLVARAAELWGREEVELPGRRDLAESFPIQRAVIEGWEELRHRFPDRVAAVADAVRGYDRLLHAFHLRDDQVAAVYPFPPVVRFVLVALLRLLIHLPLAVAGTILNWVPYRLIGVLATRFAGTSTDQTATAKLFGAVLLFPVTWTVAALLAARWTGSWWAAPAMLVAAPLAGYAALLFDEQRETFWREARAYLLLRTRKQSAAELRAKRGEVLRQMSELEALWRVCRVRSAHRGRLWCAQRTLPVALAVCSSHFFDRPAGGWMDAPSAQDTKSLPENAYKPLAPGEIYAPIVPASAQVPEASFRAVAWGVFLCVIFTVASAYSGLKVGQVMEASIPISILAIGLARAYRRRSTLLENVILTNIGGTSGGIVAGAIFTLPALYILNLNPHPLQTTLILVAGGCLGVLFLIPLRRYFVRETHGQFPFPEATAITEVLVTGEKGGSQAALLLQATGIAAVYDFFVTTFQVWRETLNFQFVPGMKMLAERARLTVGFDAISFILGLGYVMGLRSSMILCAGGALSNFVLVPVIALIGQHYPDFAAEYIGKGAIGTMTAAQIFRGYVRFIGVGAIATAGIFGIIKSLRIVAGSFSIAAKAFKQGEDAGQERTDRDMPMMTILIGVVVSTLGAAVFFARLPGASLLVAMVGLTLTLVFSFFFASVAANAIATTARNPVSGMTMLTIIVSSVVLLEFGLSGTTGMFFVMAIAGMVCVALSVSGQTITDLKTGYWLGSTPAAQERVKFLGVIASAIAAALTIVLLAKTFQFGEAAPGDARVVLASPQASIMKALVESFMSHQPVAYFLFGAGAVIALVMEILGLPALIFALGMYLPLELNTPALVGGFLAHYLGKRADLMGGVAGGRIRERGVIIASGLMAGGALGGVFGAALRLFPWFKESLIKTPFFDIDSVSQIVSLVLFAGLCVYLWYNSLSRSKT